MLLGPRRIILIGAIAAIALTIIFVPLIFQLTAPDFRGVVVRLSQVTLMRAEVNHLELRPIISIDNPTAAALTTARIDYELFADGVSLGRHTVSFEDIPLNGRPAIFAGGSVAIGPHPGEPYILRFNDNISEIYTKIQQNIDDVRWSARGEVLIESALVQENIVFENVL